MLLSCNVPLQESVNNDIKTLGLHSFCNSMLKMTRHPSLISLGQLMTSAPSTEYNFYLYSIAFILFRVFH